MNIKYLKDWKNLDFNQIIDLYKSVEWFAYSENPVDLKVAFDNSTYISVAKDGELVVGLIRSLSDQVSINYIQDILIHPDYQKKGVGRKLLQACLDSHKSVRTNMLLTDDEEKQLNFYQSMGFANTRNLSEDPLNAFVKMKDINLA